MFQQVKTNDIIPRRFGDLVRPLSRSEWVKASSGEVRLVDLPK